MTYSFTKIKDCHHVTFPDGSQMIKGGNLWECPGDKTPKDGWYKKNCYKLRPSIHMPRWASRITLEVVSVQVERLQDITEEDAIAEGVPPYDSSLHGICGILGENDSGNYRETFKNLWNSINGPGAWEANPWVWLIKFEVVTG